MEFGFTEGQKKLRKEVRDFFINELPEDFGGSPHGTSVEMQTFEREMERKMGAKGFLSPTWPRELGGLDMSPIEAAVISEEQGYWGLHSPGYHATGLLGPSILQYGNEEQKKRFLPELARGGDTVCMELLTEPNAGTDQANIQLRAVRNSDDWILNGQKMFVGESYKPKYLWTLARTADTTPKHRGLTLFIVPADSPGLSYRPLPVLGDYCKNEVFFDDVKVLKENQLGEMGRGFYINLGVRAQRASNLTGQAGHSLRNLEEFVEFCKEEKRNGKTLFEEPEVRKALARVFTEIQVLSFSGWYAAWQYSEREKTDAPRSDITAFLYRILAPKHAEVMMEILGPYGQLRQGSKWCKLAGKIERQWEASRSMHGGGTPERTKITLAERVLGLPASRVRPADVKARAK